MMKIGRSDTQHLEVHTTHPKYAFKTLGSTKWEVIHSFRNEMELQSRDEQQGH